MWVSQETVTASSSVTTLTAYDLLLYTNLPDPHLDMKPTETFFFEATIYSTNPATNLEFEIGELLGDVDALHFGRPAVTFGSSFKFTQSGPSDDPYNQVVNSRTGVKCNNYNYQGGRLHHLTETSSSSGLTVRKRRWRLMGVLNHEATRDSIHPDNMVGMELHYRQKFFLGQNGH